jgi:hypothetical protein
MKLGNVVPLTSIIDVHYPLTQAVVLDEVQRRSKRGLIERNRTRRQLEKRQQRLCRRLLPRLATAVEEQKVRQLSRRCARAFWAIFGDQNVAEEAEKPAEEGQLLPLPLLLLGGAELPSALLCWRIRVLKFAQALMEGEVIFYCLFSINHFSTFFSLTLTKATNWIGARFCCCWLSFGAGAGREMFPKFREARTALI